MTDLCAGLPEEFKIYLDYCRQLRFEDNPDYNYLRRLFRDLLKHNVIWQAKHSFLKIYFLTLSFQVFFENCTLISSTWWMMAYLIGWTKELHIIPEFSRNTVWMHPELFVKTYSILLHLHIAELR